MKKYLLLFVSFFFLFPVSTFALDLKLSKEDILTDGCKVDASAGYYFCNDEMILSYDDFGKIDGHLLLLRNDINKYDLDGNLVFSRKTKDYIDLLDISVVSKESNSGVKGKSDILITFYNSNDEVVFEKLYGGNGEEYLDVVVPSFNNEGVFDGYVFLVKSTSTDLTGVKAGNLIVKIDLKGNILWQHNDINKDTFVYNDDGSIESYFVVTGSSAFRKRFDTDDVIWSKEITRWGIDIISSYDENGNVNGAIAFGHSTCAQSTRWGSVAVFDLDGNKIFSDRTDCNESYYSKVFNSKNVNGIYDGYLVLGGHGNDEGFFTKYSSEGKIVWHATTSFYNQFDIVESYNSDGNFNGYVVLAQNNDDLVISRYTYPSYKIDIKEDNEGTITVNKNGFPGEIVKVSVTQKEGYTLKRIVVMGENGKEIEVSKDGTFVMPEGNVTVTAIYNRITNPKTVSACYVVLGIILLISIGTLIVNKKKEA